MMYFAIQSPLERPSSRERPPQGADRYRQDPAAARGRHHVSRLRTRGHRVDRACSRWRPPPCSRCCSIRRATRSRSSPCGVPSRSSRPGSSASRWWRAPAAITAGSADAMLFNAVEHFLPVGVAGAVICAVLLRFAPDVAWMLPGLWQMLLGVGLFVALRVPAALDRARRRLVFRRRRDRADRVEPVRTLSPWAMGLPFGLGQLLVAGLLHVACGSRRWRRLRDRGSHSPTRGSIA